MDTPFVMGVVLRGEKKDRKQLASRRQPANRKGNVIALSFWPRESSVKEETESLKAKPGANMAVVHDSHIAILGRLPRQEGARGDQGKKGRPGSQ